MWLGPLCPLGTEMSLRPSTLTTPLPRGDQLGAAAGQGSVESSGAKAAPLQRLLPSGEAPNLPIPGHRAHPPAPPAHP